jgi:hypothetical protein
MKITFAGVGSAFTDQRYYQSNMVITSSSSGKRLLIDCGGDARFSLGELGATNANIGEWADGVYISHLHADHIGGLEWLGFCTYFNPKAPKPKLFIVDTLIDELWDSLKGGMQVPRGQGAPSGPSFFEVLTRSRSTTSFSGATPTSARPDGPHHGRDSNRARPTACLIKR